MKNEKLFRAIGGVGDDLIARADEPVRRHNVSWLKWAALAACCALTIGVAALVKTDDTPTALAEMPAADAPVAAQTETKEAAVQRAAAEQTQTPELSEDAAARHADTRSAQEQYGTDWLVVNGGIYTRVYDDEEVMRRIKTKTDGLLRGAYLGDVTLSPWANVTGSPVYTVMFAEGVLEADEDGNQTDSESNYVVVAVNSVLDTANEPFLLLYRYVGEAPDLTQPLAAYIDENDAEYFCVYTADRLTYLTAAPRAMLEELDGFDAQSAEGGWQETLKIYAGVCGERVWVLAVAPPALGTQKQNFAATDDGGETWQIAGTEKLNCRKVNGVAFCYPEVGFISYGCYDDDGPVIYKTIDGGMSWGRIEIEVPEELEGCRLEAQTPVFYSENGTYPIDVYRKDTGELAKTAYLISRDGGEHWEWQS